MAKKESKPKLKTVVDESNLKNMAGKIMESGQQIWLAGLGAFAKAQEEGTKLYDALIKEGSALEKITTKYTTSKVDEVRGAVENTVSSVKDRASDTWDKLEKVFEDRVSRALGGLGIPGREELNELSLRVEELSRAVKALQKTPASKSAAAPSNKSAAAPSKAPLAKAPVVAKPVAAKAPVATPAKPTAKPVSSSIQNAVKTAQVKSGQAMDQAKARAKATVAKAKQVANDAVVAVSDAVTGENNQKKEG